MRTGLTSNSLTSSEAHQGMGMGFTIGGSAVARLAAAWLAIVCTLPIAARATDPPAAGLGRYLDPSGHLALPAGYEGSLDPSGFALVSKSGEAPRFAAVQKGIEPSARWASEFRGANGCANVYAMLVVPSGEIYLGGGFSSCGGTAANSIVRYDPVAETWTPLRGPGGGNGISSTGAGDSTVYSIAQVGADIYVGGSFARANVGGDVVIAYNLARWDGTQWHAVGTPAGQLGRGTNNRVDALAASGTDLYVGGFFTGVDGLGGPYPASRIVRWDGSAWHRLGAAGSDGLNGRVSALLVDGDDLYVGGSFDTAGGVPAMNIARWDGSAWSSLGSGDGNGVNDVAGGPAELFVGVRAMTRFQDDLYVGGSFERANAGGTSAIAAINLARWDGGAWSAVGTIDGGVMPGVPRTEVGALQVDGDGDTLYIGGQFTSAQGASAPFIAQWNGTSLEPLGGIAGNGVAQTVRALAWSDDALFVGGFFGRAGVGQTLATEGVARWDGSTWSPLDAGVGFGTDGTIYATAVYRGDVYIGGYFRHAGGVRVNGIARWTGSGWAPVGHAGGNGLGADNNGIMAMTVFEDALYIGGGFAQINRGAPITVNHLARWDGVEWSAVGNGVAGGGVNALLGLDSELYVGGTFATANPGAVAVNRIARWDGTAWSAVGSEAGNGFDGEVLSFAAMDGDLYVGGWFNNANVGAPVATRRIARWDGDTWSALGSGGGNGTNNPVESMVAIGSDLYVTGTFGTVNHTGASGPPQILANRIARWNPSTGWSKVGVDAGNGVNDWINAVVAIDGSLYAGGLFTVANTGGTQVATSYVARWNGSVWTPLGPGVAVGPQRMVHALAVEDADTLWVAGEFGAAGGRAAMNVSRYSTRGTLSVSLSGDGSGSVTGPADLACPGDCSVDLPWDTGATLVAVPAEDSELVAWSGACSGNAACVVSMSESASIGAEFAIKQYDVSGIADGEGSVTPSSQSIRHGDTATVTVTPAAFHHLVDVVGDTCSPEDNGDGTWSADDITADCTITARFEIDTYAVGLEISGNGSVSPIAGLGFGLDAVPHGSAVVLDVSAASGHRVASASGCGEGSFDASSARYTSAAVTGACTIEIEFNRNPVAIDGVLSLLEDTPLSNATLGASDDDASLMFELLDDGTRGTAVLLDAATGAYTYTPTTDEFGSDTLSFSVSDGGATSAPGTIAVTIVPVNDAPILLLGAAPTHPASTSGPQHRVDHATLVVGPDNESAQGVDDYLIGEIADPDGVLVAASVDIDNDGALSYTLTGVGGIANVAVRARDDGGTANGGIDLSAPTSFPITVAPSADLQIAKDDGRDQAQVGEELVYSITVTNAGPNAASGASLVDDVPSTLVDVAWLCVEASAGAACPPPPGDAGTGDLATTIDLPVASYLRYELSGIVQGSVGSSVVNTARVEVPAGLVDPESGNDASTDTILIVPEGIFGDGFEAGGNGLSVDAAARAQRAGIER